MSEKTRTRILKTIKILVFELMRLWFWSKPESIRSKIVNLFSYSVVQMEIRRGQIVTFFLI